jgi:hypothetical protein
MSEVSSLSETPRACDNATSESSVGERLPSSKREMYAIHGWGPKGGPGFQIHEEAGRVGTENGPVGVTIKDRHSGG